jgi:glycerol-3-phosphate dehydrogenase (NAD(P)+)
MLDSISIFGAGAFGTALAESFARNGSRTYLWARNSATVDEINATHKNTKYSGSHLLDSKIHALTDLSEALEKSSLWVYACPSSNFRNFLSDIKTLALKKKPILLDTSKGIEPESLALHTQIANQVLGSEFEKDYFQILSGPSFAKEILENIPTSVCVAGHNPSALEKTQARLASKNFRLYASYDPIGSQVGGASKNVIAIALGIADGLGLGQNTRAALLNRGLIEIAKLGEKLGAKPQTFLGLSCLGDLLLTCSSLMSRNFRFGHLLGKGLSLAAAQKEIASTIEGALSAKSVYDLSLRHQLELPICHEVFHVLHKGKAVDEAYEDLLSRPTGVEWE